MRGEDKEFDALLEIGGGNVSVVEMRASRAIGGETQRRVRDALRDFPYLSADEERISRIAAITEAIVSDAQNAVEAYLNIGFRLIELEEQFDGQRSVLNHYLDARLIPISRSYASKIMAVAKAYRDGRFERAIGHPIEAKDLPSITVAYELKLLDDDGLKAAADRGLIAPSTTQSAVEEFREKLLAAAASDGAMTPRKVQQMIFKLEEKRDRKRAEVTQIEAKIAELRAMLTPVAAE